MKKDEIQIRKYQESFFVFNYWNLKLVSIDSALNFGLKNLTHLLQNCGCGTQRSRQIWKSGLKCY